jgi:hypothetical protein
MTSHMKKKKAKRYQEGGEAEDKKRGLAASNKEGSVGFFERLRMGNIDDPKSEAYKRFGAGRGQAETAKEKAAIKAYKGPSEAGMGTQDSPSPFTGSTGNVLQQKLLQRSRPKPRSSPKSNSRHLALTISVTILMIDVASSDVANQPPVSLQLQLHVDPTVAPRTKVTLAKKQLVRPKKPRWPKPVRCASKQILAMYP